MDTASFIHFRGYWCEQHQPYGWLALLSQTTRSVYQSDSKKIQKDRRIARPDIQCKEEQVMGFNAAGRSSDFIPLSSWILWDLARCNHLNVLDLFILMTLKKTPMLRENDGRRRLEYTWWLADFLTNLLVGDILNIKKVFNCFESNLINENLCFIKMQGIF